MSSENSREPSTLSKMGAAFASGYNNPSTAANGVGGIIGSRAPGISQDTKDNISGIAQGSWEAGKVAGEALGERMNEEYGNPSGDLNNMQIQQAIEDGASANGINGPLPDNGENFTFNEDTGETVFHGVQESEQDSAPEQKQNNSPEQETTPKQETAPEQEIFPEQNINPEQNNTPEIDTASNQEVAQKPETAPEQNNTPTKEANTPMESKGETADTSQNKGNEPSNNSSPSTDYDYYNGIG